MELVIHKHIVSPAKYICPRCGKTIELSETVLKLLSAQKDNGTISCILICKNCAKEGGMKFYGEQDFDPQL